MTSDDGRTFLVRPDGVDADITITRTDPPAELADAGGHVLAYDLQPSGLEFPKPATLTVTIPASETGAGSGVPVYAAVLLDDGVGEALEATTARAGDDLRLEVAVPHFSRVLLLNTDQEFELDPTQVEARVGDTFVAKVRTEGNLDGVPVFIAISGSALHDGPSADPASAVFTCVSPTGGGNEGTYGVQLGTVLPGTFADGALLGQILGGRSADEHPLWFVELTGDATCLPADGDDASDDEGGGKAVAVDDPAGDFEKVGPGDPEPAEAPPEVDITGFSWSWRSSVRGPSSASPSPAGRSASTTDPVGRR